MTQKARYDTSAMSVDKRMCTNAVWWWFKIIDYEDYDYDNDKEEGNYYDCHAGDHDDAAMLEIIILNAETGAMLKMLLL